MLDAAPPDLAAVAVEEGDREILLLEPVVAGEVEGRLGQRQQEEQADRAERRALAGQVEREPLPAAEREDLHERAEPLVGLARRMAALVEAGIDPRVEAERGAAHARLQGLEAGQAQGFRSLGRPAGTRSRRPSTFGAGSGPLSRIKIRAGARA